MLALDFVGMILSENRFPLFRIMLALVFVGMILSENRFPLFRIMLALDFCGHDPFGKPVSTFPDHALGCRRN
jgi:hypothetical protein